MKKRHKLISFVVVAFFLIGTVSLIGLNACSSVDQHQSQEIQTIEEQKYSSLISSWNQYAKEITHRYTFVGADIASSAAVISKFSQWVDIFYENPSAEYERQLAAFHNDIPESTFSEYDAYRKKHYTSQKIQLLESMDEIELATALNSIAKIQKNGRILNYISYDTVQTILEMNDICLFFDSKKESIHAKGIDTNIMQCRELGTNGKYPELDILIK